MVFDKVQLEKWKEASKADKANQKLKAVFGKYKSLPPIRATNNITKEEL